MENPVDSTLETKFLSNLQWSMLFFVFNQICNSINEDNELEGEETSQKQFIKNWKKFAYDNIVKGDLKMINEILNTPKNIFHSAFQNKAESVESTELYQQKYNATLKQIENFFLKSLGGDSTDFLPKDDDEENA